MKSILLITTFLFALSASANTIIAKYDFGVQNSFDNGKFVKSTLTEDGSLSIEIYNHLILANSAARPSASELIFAQINPKNLQFIISKIIPTTQAQVVTTYSEIICMLMPSGFMESDHLYLNRTYNSHTGEFIGDLELVHGPQGCWVSGKVSLDNTQDNQRAYELKSTLKLLINEYAGHLL
mgnify:CR=1 FL=1